MDPVALGAIGTILVGVIAAAASFYGQRGASRANHQGAVMTGFGSLVDQLQEERADLKARLSESEQRLTAAYTELASERADKTRLVNEIAALQAEVAALRRRIAELGGAPT